MKLAAPTFPLHPVVKCFPSMDAEMYKKLRDDIRENGIVMPVILWQGQVIDGRHRQQIAKELGIQIPIQEEKVNEEVAIKLARSLNQYRRHLTPSQLALIGAELVKVYAPIAAAVREENLPNHGKSPKASVEAFGKASAKAANDVGVSRASIERAKKVSEEADAKVVEAIREGKATVRDAEAIVKEPKEIQKEAAQAVAEGKARTLRAAVRQARANGKHQPSEDAEPIYDPNGRVIPPEMVPCVEDGKALMDASKQFAEFLGLIKDMRKDPIRGCRLRAGVETDLENLRSALEAASFYCVCVYCNGTGYYCKEPCSACKRAGWINHLAYKGAPSELRKKVPA